jgi:hypothetical protein
MPNLRAVDHHPGAFDALDFLQRERTSYNLLCQHHPVFFVLPIDPHTVVDADKIVIDLPHLFQHLEHCGAKKFLQGLETNIGYDVQAAVWQEQTVGNHRV